MNCARFSDAHQAFLAAITANVPPRTYNEAIQDERWKNSVTVEMDARRSITHGMLLSYHRESRWIFTIKFNADGTIERFKARLVALGNRQKDGIYYDEMFVHVVKISRFERFSKLQQRKIGKFTK